jgi:hypothetical protein
MTNQMTAVKVPTIKFAAKVWAWAWETLRIKWIQIYANYQRTAHNPF